MEQITGLTALHTQKFKKWRRVKRASPVRAEREQESRSRTVRQLHLLFETQTHTFTISLLTTRPAPTPTWSEASPSVPDSAISSTGLSPPPVTEGAAEIQTSENHAPCWTGCAPSSYDETPCCCTRGLRWLTAHCHCCQSVSIKNLSWKKICC